MDAFVQKLFAAAKEAGIDAAEAYVVEEESFQAVATQQEITQYSANATRGLGFRAMVEGRMGYAATEAFDDAAVTQLVQGVLDSARYTEDKDEQFLYEGRDLVPALELYSPALEEVTPEEKLAFVLELEREAKACDPRVEKVGHTTILTGKHATRIVNTYGMDRQYSENECGAYLQPIAHEGESTSAGMEVMFAHDFSRLNARQLAADAVKIAVDGLHASPVPSGQYRVIFQNTAMTDLLSVFSEAFSAENAQKGLSLLKGKIGESIAAPQVTLIDDPLLENGLATRPFDAEGVPSKAHVLVEKGKFLTFLHNLKTAHKDGVETTGNASKAGYAASVRVAPSNFYIQAGSQSLEEMLQDADGGLLITEVSGLHAGANAVSGDFSLLSKGFVIQCGKRAKPVEQITVAGNFWQMLRKIRQIGCDLRFPQSGIGSPSVDVGELSVGGT